MSQRSVQQETDGNGLTGYTLAVLGCGTMGIAMLSGIFQSLTASSTARTECEEQTQLPNKFIATFRRPAAAARIRNELGQYSQFSHLALYGDENARAARAADVVLLACAPHQAAAILQQPGLREALAGKLLIHILAGVPTTDLQYLLYGEDWPEDEPRCTIVRTLPNAAAAVRQSGTAVAISEPPLSLEHDTIVHQMFSQVGRVVYLSESQMNIAAVLGGSTPAIMASMIEGIAQGGIELGTPMRESYELAAQAMIAAGTLVLQGKHPAVVRDECSCPGGCTARCLAVIEEGAVRGTLARAVREGVAVAETLGGKE